MEEDEEIFCKYGTPLPAYGEDEVPAKKPVSVEDQIVLDVNGKRRFHGAFTGGFSAGYWNTVGSEEGWKPTEFKSSRGEKASFKLQNAMDFMDEEDLGEFGIAPQRVQAKEDFAQSSKGAKRPAQIELSGPIPGQPVLKALLKPAREKTAVHILKTMGWREGQGIGDRQSRAEKKKIIGRNKKEQYVMKMYGCALPTANNDCDSTTESDSDISEYEVTFAPDDFDPLVAAIKDNSFGLGYSGLQRQSAARLNLFDTLEVVDRNNKKLSIRGQAFGVGALEEDDEDIYAKDDMSNYDSSLENKPEKVSALKTEDKFACLEGFCPKKLIGKHSKNVFRVVVPENFTPRNWGKRFSRFEPLNEKTAENFEKQQYYIRGLGRHELTPSERSQVLGESSKNVMPGMIDRKTETIVTEACKKLSKDSIKFDLKAELESLGSTKEGFKPFITDSDKQERYEKFVHYKTTEQYRTNQEFLSSLQPLGMSEWDREREFKEFIQAQRMYRPMDGLMSDRFVTESNVIAAKEIESFTNPRDVKLKRSKSMWKPYKDLCKRFNVPEPFGGILDEEIDKPKTKVSVFSYLETPLNKKVDFITPVVIPKSSSKITDSLPVKVSEKKNNLEAEIPSTSYERIPREQFTQQRSVDVKTKPVKQSELELKVLECVNKTPDQKKDLFRSIFCSSDEDENHGENELKQSEMTSMKPSEKLKLVESLVAVKPSSEVNILRNDSPPRGIFKSILEIRTSQQLSEAQIIRHPELNETLFHAGDIGDEYYGPKLPNSVTPLLSTLLNPANDEAQNNRLEEVTGNTHGLVEKWIEKKNTMSGKSKKRKHKDHKKSKKHKKEKKKKK